MVIIFHLQFRKATWDPNGLNEMALINGGLYEPGSKLVVLGMVIPPLIGNPYNGYINPYYGLMTIPYYMEIMGVYIDPSTYT